MNNDKEDYKQILLDDANFLIKTIEQIQNPRDIKQLEQTQRILYLMYESMLSHIEWLKDNL